MSYIIYLLSRQLYVMLILCYYGLTNDVDIRQREHFERLYEEIMSLAHFYMVSAILIRYSTLHMNIIILETSYTKFNMFNLVHHLLYA